MRPEDTQAASSRNSTPVVQESKRDKFKRDLESLVNNYSLENGSDTPDFVLAEYLLNCLDAWDQGLREREKWYGRDIAGHKVDRP